MSLVDKISDAIKAIGKDVKTLIDNKVDKSALGSAAYKDLGTNVDEVVTAQNAFIASASIGVEDYYGANLDPKFDVNDMVSGQKVLVNTVNLNTPPRTSKEFIYHIECKRLHEGKYEDYLLFVAYGYITGEVYTRVRRGNIYTPWVHTSQSVDNFDRTTVNLPNVYIHDDGKLYRSDIADRLLPLALSTHQNQSMQDIGRLSEGWYTIAVNPDRSKISGQRAFADFVITERRSGMHCSMSFKAGITYGNNPFINLLGISSYNRPSRVISAIRIKYGETYDGAILQIYSVSSDDIDYIKMTDNLADSGFILLDKPALEGSEVETSLVKPLINLDNLINNKVLDIKNDMSASFSGFIDCQGVDIRNGALIADAGDYNFLISSTNLDHLWHSDRDNTWHFCSDTTYKGQGNSNVQAGAVSSGPASYPRAWRKITDKIFGSGASTLTVAHGVTNISGLSVMAVIDGTAYYQNDVRDEYQFTVESTDADIIIKKGADASGLDGATVTIYIDEDMS